MGFNVCSESPFITIGETPQSALEKRFSFLCGWRFPCCFAPDVFRLLRVFVRTSPSHMCSHCYGTTPNYLGHRSSKQTRSSASWKSRTYTRTWKISSKAAFSMMHSSFMVWSSVRSWKSMLFVSDRTLEAQKHTENDKAKREQKFMMPLVYFPCW